MPSLRNPSGFPPRRWPQRSAPETDIADVVYERKRLTPELAAKLSGRFGATPEFWLKLQSAYDSSFAGE